MISLLIITSFLRKHNSENFENDLTHEHILAALLWRYNLLAINALTLRLIFAFIPRNFQSTVLVRNLANKVSSKHLISHIPQKQLALHRCNYDC